MRPDGSAGGRRSLPYQCAVEREQYLLIEAALERISPIFREAVVLRDITDLSYEEIADGVRGVSGDSQIPNPARA